MTLKCASFLDPVGKFLEAAQMAAREVSAGDLYKAIHGNYALLLAKHSASASSRLFFLETDARSHNTWWERRGYSPTFRLTPSATPLLLDNLRKSVVALRAITGCI